MACRLLGNQGNILWRRGDFEGAMTFYESKEASCW